MIICGLKLTHDAAVCIIDSGKLQFSIELEKINNNPRYSAFSEFEEIVDILNDKGYSINDVDHFVIDGWGNLNNDKQEFIANLKSKSGAILFPLAKYGHLVSNENLLTPRDFFLSNLNFGYKSYMHVSGHVFSSYCTSPFSKEHKSSYILVWDGGMLPQLFYFDSKNCSIKNLRPLFGLNGNIYTAFAQQYFPFSSTDKNDLSVSGKVMAYIAKGQNKTKVLEDFFNIYYSEVQDNASSSDRFRYKLYTYGVENDISPEDMMATFHTFLERLLVKTLQEKILLNQNLDKRICISGGCALNIKWNAAIRASNIFEDVWVPPFPNDSGNAIGVACCEMIKRTGNFYLEWDVYSGPSVKPSNIIEGWKKIDCPLPELAKLIYETGEPIVVLQGNAELGPRALGNRSILASPIASGIKDFLNEVKDREKYRPIAPLCLEEMAQEFFIPGTHDPFMLFDHKIKREWRSKLSSIAHIDNTARLQTVSESSNAFIYNLLQHFAELSGIPILCNTSANFNGKGFFPDVESVMKWGRLNYIFSNGILYYKKSNSIFINKIGINEMSSADESLFLIAL